MASEAIAHEIKLPKSKGKTVTASMANVAASGGYYIAAHAHNILAMPRTIMGSIGVVAGKLKCAGLLNNLGIHPKTVKTNENVDMFSSMTGFTNKQVMKMDTDRDVIMIFQGSAVIILSDRITALVFIEVIKIVKSDSELPRKSF